MTPSSAHDFDFLHGHWHVSHRRLRERLCGNVDWQNFDGTCSAQAILGGGGNVDDNLLHLPGGSYRAATLRTHDPQTGRWSIWWLDGRHPHRLDVPVVGSFDQGIGTFFAQEGVFEFANPDWGPQAVGLILSASSTLSRRCAMVSTVVSPSPNSLRIVACTSASVS